MSLTAQERADLPSSKFAVPDIRCLPIHDKAHVIMAWGVVELTKISLAQRKEAKRNILHAANYLGVDTSSWRLQSMHLSAMSLAFPTPNETHPNKVPFTGILTRLDVVSDKPLSGTGGKKVIISKAVAREALPSLLGMAIDFTPRFDGHRPRAKLGLITSADVVEDAIEISGFFYGADFPEEVQYIQTNKEKMGFSFEAQSLMESMDADPLVVEACEFTGAAVLFKDKAAYYDTSIAARADQEQSMDPKDKEQIDAMQTSLTAIAASVKGIVEGMGTMVDAAVKKALPTHAASVLPMVSTHAAALRTCAAQMAAAGIGNHASQGHVVVLNRMADRLEAEASLGALPHIFRDHDFLMAGAHQIEANSGLDQKALLKSITDGFAEILKPVTDSVAALGTQVADMKTKIAASANQQAPQRKTLSPEVAASLKRMGIEANAEGAGIKVADFDSAAKKAGLQPTQSMAIKLALKDAGQLIV